MKLATLVTVTLSLTLSQMTTQATEIDPALFWQGKERSLRYLPEGEEFVNQNGDKRFSRAIYGTNTGFRFETSDFPEFGLYMPRLGGSIYLALSTPEKNVWIKDLELIESRFKSGQRTYLLKDQELLGDGSITIDAVAQSDADGLIVSVQPTNLPESVTLHWIYGGANHQRFSREGDLGADPEDSFYIKPQNCDGNEYAIAKNTFTIYYGHDTPFLSDDKAYENADTLSTRPPETELPSDINTITGTFPPATRLRLGDANQLSSIDELLTSKTSAQPVLIASYELASETFYFEFHDPDSRDELAYSELDYTFEQGVAFRERIASRLKLKTPDPFLNTLGGIFAGAEDAIWESPGYLHGAIGWRMPLTGWRAAYLADLLGLNDRARLHFNGYINSQVTDVPVSLPHLQDEKLNLARSAKVWGTPMYSNGYIARRPNEPDVMHHYDMNLVFIDELLWHLNWTGDLDYARKVFPTIQRHLAWEKNTFDPDNDSLYDAYCAIWPSDALQYNGGKGTHSSAYNYRANKLTAEIARKIGEDPRPYEEEAKRILQGINRELWIDEKGWWAEFVDTMGHGMRHESPAVWSIYHAIDSHVHDTFKAYQATRYIDTELPHIPVVAHGLQDTSAHVVATSTWQPYMWSINNVAFAEIMHTTLAYWQTGRPEEAFKLYKGAILDAMYLGSGPGNITQISHYDAARGETYRDFADPVSMGVRALVQGMFGVTPDLLNQRLVIKPGFPADWDFAEIETQNMQYSFKRDNLTESYSIRPNLLRSDFDLIIEVAAPTDQVSSINVNGENVAFEIIPDSVGQPRIRFNAGRAKAYQIQIEWAGQAITTNRIRRTIANGSELSLQLPFDCSEIFDPQNILSSRHITDRQLNATVSSFEGHRTFFINVATGDMRFWLPVEFEVVAPVSLVNDPDSEQLAFTLQNNTSEHIEGALFINSVNTERSVSLAAGETASFTFSAPIASFGTNQIEIRTETETRSLSAINWNVPAPDPTKLHPVNIEDAFNDKVTDIFEYGKYMSPRYKYTTLQVPTQGMGQWCHPMDLSNIDDSGLRDASEKDGGAFILPQGIPFLTPSEPATPNIAFTTLWDNYPTAINTPLSGKASKAYLLLAGSTYHMQAHVLNGQIRVNYRDGSQERLDLVLPDNLLPLDQDIFIDGWAFDSPTPRPWRVALKSASVSKYHAAENTPAEDLFPGPTYIDGGLATVLDLPLDPSKELASLELETIANEVIIGLMAVTLQR